MLYLRHWVLGPIHAPVSRSDNRKILIKPLAATILAASVLPALAEVETEGSSAKIEETIITGLKRPVSRNDYAGALSVIDQQLLQATSPSSVVDIAAMVPGLFAQDTGSRNPTPVFMRGVNFDGMSSNDLGGDSNTVASYLDNIALQGYYAPPQVLLKDLQSVEVLRGPQGTLYGASSLAGVISYQTAKPVMNEFSLSLHGQLSQTAESDDLNMDSDIVLNLPIIDDLLALRAMISYSENAGFIDNDYLLDGPKDDINDDDITAGRLSLLLTPTERLAVSLMLQSQKTQSGDFQADNPDFTGKIYNANTAYLQPMEGDLDLADLEVIYDFDTFSLEVTGNYYAYDLEQISDYTALYQQWGYTEEFDGGDNGYEQGNVEVDQGSVEARLVSHWSGPVNGIIGINYTENDVDISRAYQLTNYPGDFKVLEYTYTQNQALEDIALFTELTWQVSEPLSLTAGGRYFDYSDDAKSCSAYYSDALDCVDEKIDDSDTSFSLAGLYRVDTNLSLYANISEGYRRGGANPGLPDDLSSRRSYAPDTSVNYEVGLHSQLWQQRLQLDVALFYIDWKDIQLSSGEYDNNDEYFSYIANANAAVSQGLEIELTGQITDSLRIVSSYAYSDASLADDSPSYNDVEGDGENGFKGDRLPGSPKHQAYVALLFEQAIQQYVMDASLTGNYIGDVTTQLNKEHLGYNTLGGYTLLSASLGLSLQAWRIGIFANNLTNKRAVAAQEFGPYGPASALNYVVRPRTLGLDVRYNF